MTARDNQTRQDEAPAGGGWTPPAPFHVPDADHARELAVEVILRVAAQVQADIDARRLPDATMIDDLADFLREEEAGDKALALVQAARLRGMPADALYHGLVAPAVERVGRAWTGGEITMAGMMRASLRTWRILCDLRDAFVLVTDRVPGQEAVFALCPEECHTLGLTMTADDLRRRGWEVELLIGYGHDELVAQMDRLSPTTVALAATGSDMVLPLARLVVALRAHLPGVWIMVGGSITESVASLLALTGADAVANTAEEAERLMKDHIAERAAQRANRI